MRSGLLFSLLVVALLASACGAPQDSNDGSAESPAGPGESEPVRVEIGQAGLGGTFSEVYLARELGFFEEEGIIVGEIPSLGGAVMEGVLSEDLHFGMGLDGPDRAIAATKGIEEPIIVGTFTNPTARQIIVSREWIEEHDIRPDQPLAERMAALRGATFAHLSPGPSGSIQNLLIREYGGFGEDDIDVVYMEGGPAAMLSSLGERIDVFFWNPPFGPLAEMTGAGAPIASFAEFPEYQFPELTLMTRRSFAEENKDLVVRTIRAILRARRFMHEQPREAAEHLKETVFQDSSIEVLMASLEILLQVKPVERLMEEEEWQRLIDHMVNIGDLEEPVSAAEGVMWTNEYLREAIETLDE